MNAVVDTNVLFNFFWRDSFIRKILISPGNKFYSPELAVKELEKYSPLIISKTGISKKEFSNILKDLISFVKIVPKRNYKKFIEFALGISPDKDDSEFLALCLKLNLPLWSNDRKLKNQDNVIVLDTEDLIDMMF